MSAVLVYVYVLVSCGQRYTRMDGKKPQGGKNISSGGEKKVYMHMCDLAVGFHHEECFLCLFLLQK